MRLARVVSGRGVAGIRIGGTEMLQRILRKEGGGCAENEMRAHITNLSVKIQKNMRPVYAKFYQYFKGIAFGLKNLMFHFILIK